MMMANVRRMGAWMEKAKANGSDIVVFPETAIESIPATDTAAEGWERDTVLPFLEPVPDPAHGKVNPCAEEGTLNDSAPIIVALSCLARRHAIAAVFDVGDVQPCSAAPVRGGCRADGRAQFNTAVAFDSDGALLVKYHKQHLYKEEWFDVDAEFHKGRFTPSFGVPFGIFICNDINYEKTEPDDVSNFVFPTFWEGTSAASAQQSWSRKHGANFLAANIAGLGTSGFGIYSKGAALAKYVDPNMRPVDKMLIADVTA